MNIPRSIRYSFFLLSIILSLYGIILAKDFLYPVTIGMLLAYLLFPITNFLEKKNFPRIAAILISLILGVAVIYGLAIFVINQVSLIVSDFPTLRKQAINNIDAFQNYIESYLRLSDIALDDFLKQSVTNLFEFGSEGFNKVFTATTGTILKVGLMPVYIFLFLYYRTKFAYFILKIVKEEKRLIAINVLRSISKVATRYMGGVFIVVLILCVLNSIGLSIIGIRYAVALGIISAIFNFIPYFGTLIGGSIPFLFALLTESSPLYAVKVLILFIIIQSIENNILTPNIVGNNLQINPFFIILGIIAAAMIWGIPGMIIIVPALAITKIICENTETLTPVAYLLGPKGTQRHAITVNNVKRVIQKIKRLFSGKAASQV